MTRLIRQRTAQVDAQQTEMKAQLAAAASAQAQLARQKPWRAPSIRPQGVVQPAEYIDLSDKPIAPPSSFKMDATRTRYPRSPAMVFPSPTLLLTSCPGSNSIKGGAFGARGDGATDDSGAIAKAASQLGELYFPPGMYRISTSITIDKPIIMGTGAQLSVDAGVTLTLTQRPRLWDARSGIFGGPGRVVLSGSADEVSPDWFRRAGESDSDTLQRSIDSCATSCTLLLTRYHSLTKPVFLRPTIGVISSQGALLDGRWGGGQGIIVRPGKYTLPLQFATMWGFSNFALRIQGGVSRAEIQINTIIEGKDGVVFAPQEGSSRRITNVWVTHLTATNSLQNSVAFQASSPVQQIRNCVVRANFILQGGFLQPDQQSAGLVVRGAVPQLVATSVVFQAVEAAQFWKQTKFMFLQNLGRRPVTGLVYQVQAWGGGLVTSGQLVAGKFKGLKLLSRMSGGVPGAAQFMTIQGPVPNNRVSLGNVASAGVEYQLMEESTASMSFNSGKPVLEQVTYVRAPIRDTWVPGETRTFYFYNAYASTVPGSRMEVIPFRAANPGLVVVGMESQHDIEPYRVAVQIRNNAGYAMPSWLSSHRFGIQLGP